MTNVILGARAVQGNLTIALPAKACIEIPILPIASVIRATLKRKTLDLPTVCVAHLGAEFALDISLIVLCVMD